MPKLNETFPSLTYFILENRSPKQSVLFIHFNDSFSDKNKQNWLKQKPPGCVVPSQAECGVPGEYRPAAEQGGGCAQVFSGR